VVDQVAGEGSVVRDAASTGEGHQDTEDGHGQPHLGYRRGQSTCSQIWASLETFPRRARTTSEDLAEGPPQQHVGGHNTWLHEIPPDLQRSGETHEHTNNPSPAAQKKPDKAALFVDHRGISSSRKISLAADPGDLEGVESCVYSHWRTKNV